VKYFKQFSLYTFVGFLNAGISFLIMPYISHHIDSAGNGILSMVNSLVTINIQLMGITAADIINIEHYNKKNSQEFAFLFPSILLNDINIITMKIAFIKVKNPWCRFSYIYII